MDPKLNSHALPCTRLKSWHNTCKCKDITVLQAARAKGSGSREVLLSKIVNASRENTACPWPPFCCLVLSVDSRNLPAINCDTFNRCFLVQKSCPRHSREDLHQGQSYVIRCLRSNVKYIALSCVYTNLGLCRIYYS